MVEPEIIPAKRGAPTKYQPEFCDRIIREAEQGGHIPAMMAAIGCMSKDTWYRWKEEHPEFKEAVEAAELVSQAHYERLGYMGMTGQIPNFNATIFALIMNNKFKHDYSRSSNGPSTEITINTVNLPPEQFREKIAQKLEKLRSLGYDFDPANDQPG